MTKKLRAKLEISAKKWGVLEVSSIRTYSLDNFVTHTHAKPDRLNPVYLSHSCGSINTYLTEL